MSNNQIIAFDAKVKQADHQSQITYCDYAGGKFQINNQGVFYLGIDKDKSNNLLHIQALIESLKLNYAHGVQLHHPYNCPGLNQMQNIINKQRHRVNLKRFSSSVLYHPCLGFVYRS